LRRKGGGREGEEGGDWVCVGVVLVFDGGGGGGGGATNAHACGGGR